MTQKNDAQKTLSDYFPSDAGSQGLYPRQGHDKNLKDQVNDIASFRKGHSIPDDVLTLVRVRVAGIVSWYTDRNNPFIPNVNQPMSVRRLWELCYLITNGECAPNGPQVGGVYAEVIKEIGMIPKEYIQPLALGGLWSLIKENTSREVWFSRTRNAIDNNPDLGYLTLTRSPRSNISSNSESFVYHMHGTMVGLYLHDGMPESEIFNEVTRHTPSLRLIAMEMSWGKDSVALRITQEAMISLATRIIDGTYTGFQSIEFLEETQPTGFNFQGDYRGKFVDYPNQLADTGLALDALVSYGNKTMTKGEAYTEMTKHLKAFCKEKDIKVLHPSSSGRTKKVVTLLGIDPSTENASFNFTILKGREGLSTIPLETLMPPGKSDIAGKLLREGKLDGLEITYTDSESTLNKDVKHYFHLWAGSPVSNNEPINRDKVVALVNEAVEKIKSDTGRGPKDIVVLGAGPRIRIGETQTSHIHCLNEMVYSPHKASGVFITKSNRDEVISGKNNSWPKPKTRKGHK